MSGSSCFRSSPFFSLFSRISILVVSFPVDIVFVLGALARMDTCRSPSSFTLDTESISESASILAMPSDRGQGGSRRVFPIIPLAAVNRFKGVSLEPVSYRDVNGKVVQLRRAGACKRYVWGLTRPDWASSLCCSLPVTEACNQMSDAQGGVCELCPLVHALSGSLFIRRKPFLR
jgi:hypothetical protein